MVPLFKEGCPIKKSLLACLPLLALLFTGCWDRVELENRDFVIVLGADKAETGEGLTLTLCLGATGEENAALVTHLTGPTPAEALSRLAGRTAHRSYYGSARTLVVGQALWNDPAALSALLTELETLPDLNQRLLVVVAAPDANHLVAALPASGVPYGMYFSTFFKNHPETPALDLESARLALSAGEPPPAPVFVLDAENTPALAPTD